MAVMSLRSLDSYSKCHWHNGRQPLSSFDHRGRVREQPEQERRGVRVRTARTSARLPLPGRAPRPEI